MAQTDSAGGRSTSDDNASGATKGVPPAVTKTNTVNGVTSSVASTLGGNQVRFPGGGVTTTDTGR